MTIKERFLKRVVRAIQDKESKFDFFGTVRIRPLSKVISYTKGVKIPSKTETDYNYIGIKSEEFGNFVYNTKENKFETDTSKLKDYLF